jgi:hypothetical protein
MDGWMDGWMDGQFFSTKIADKNYLTIIDKLQDYDY